MSDLIPHNQPDTEPKVQPDLPTEPVEDQSIPSSVDTGHETAVEPFKDTPLKRAHDEQLLGSQYRPELPWYKKPLAKVAGGALALTAALGIGAKLGQGEDDTTKQPSAVSVDETPTTEAPRPLEPEDQDFRPEDEQTDAIEYVYAASDSAEDVVAAIYKNLELANERRDTGYLTYYLADRESEYAQGFIRDIESLDNNYPVSIKVSNVEDLGKQTDGWHVKVTREFDVDTPGVFDGEPQNRELVLTQKLVLRQNPQTREYYEQNIWVISKDIKIA